MQNGPEAFNNPDISQLSDQPIYDFDRMQRDIDRLTRIVSNLPNTAGALLHSTDIRSSQDSLVKVSLRKFVFLPREQRENEKRFLRNVTREQLVGVWYNERIDRTFWHVILMITVPQGLCSECLQRISHGSHNRHVSGMVSLFSHIFLFGVRW